MPARRVSRPDELGPVLKEAMAHEGGPFLVDVVLETSTSQTYPNPDRNVIKLQANLTF